MSSGFIEGFCEHDMFSTHFDMLFAGDSPPLPWDENHAYTRESVELYYQSNAGCRACLTKKKSFGQKFRALFYDLQRCFNYGCNKEVYS